MPMDRSFQNFASDCRGSVAILFGLSLVVLLGAVGLAIDTSRFYDFTSKMQLSMDAAALAGAKLLPDSSQTDASIAALVQAHFRASMTNAGVKANSITPLDTKIDRAKATVEVTGRARLPTFFARILSGSSEPVVFKSAKVAYDIKKVELSMVLDITGSMNTNNKIADLKVAANDVIDELLQDSVSEDAVRIALAPYSASVNAGELAATVSVVPPTKKCKTSNAGSSCQDNTGVDVDTCVIERTGPAAATDAAPVGADRLQNASTPPPAGYFCPTASVVPLLGKSSIDTLKSILGGYSAQGATAGHIGTAWGWYLLSPEWAGVLPAASAPKPYDDASVEKSMIVMTDGLFNKSYIGGGASDAATQINESYAQFSALCSGAKAKKIKVYTVGFDLSDPRALSELQACASDPSSFFDVKTGADLKKAFHTIAQKLNTLRISG